MREEEIVGNEQNWENKRKTVRIKCRTTWTKKQHSPYANYICKNARWR